MSQKEAILDWLKSGRTITQREALAQFGCWRLASRISDLRREGHPIVTVNKKVKDTLEDELADVVLRVTDLCGLLGIDLETHIKAKMRYNATRPYKHNKAY